MTSGHYRKKWLIALRKQGHQPLYIARPETGSYVTHAQANARGYTTQHNASIEADAWQTTGNLLFPGWKIEPEPT